MICPKTGRDMEECYCAACTDRENERVERELHPLPKPIVHDIPHEISVIHEYGLTERLQNPIRCF